MSKKAKEKKRRGAKDTEALAKKDKAGDSEILATMTSRGKTVNIEKWHIRGISLPPLCIAGSSELNEEHKKTRNRSQRISCVLGVIARSFTMKQSKMQRSRLPRPLKKAPQ